MKLYLILTLLLPLELFAEELAPCKADKECLRKGVGRTTSTISGKVVKKIEGCGKGEQEARFSPLCVLVESKEKGEVTLKLGLERFSHADKLPPGTVASFEVFEPRRALGNTLIIKSFTVNGETFTLRNDSGEPTWKDIMKKPLRDRFEGGRGKRQ